MNLDMNLMREILKALNAKEINDIDRAMPQIAGYSEEAHSNHCMMLKDNGFIQAKKMPGGTMWAVLPGQKSLTLEGNNFLKFLQDDNNWSKVKELDDFKDVLKFWRSWVMSK